MAAPVLDALNSILQYQQSRDKSDLSEALALMQFAQARKASNVAMFEKQIMFAEKAQSQMKGDVAKGFLTSSGLQAIADIVPTGIEDQDDIEGEIKDLVTKLKSKDYGKFSEQRASQIASALWAFKNANEPSAIIDIAAGLDRMMALAAGGEATAEQEAFITSISSIAADASLQEVSRLATKSLEFDQSIRKEQFEFAEGDTEIQSDFGLYDPQVVQDFKESQTEQQDLDFDKIFNLVQTEVNDEAVYKPGYVPPTNNELLQKVEFLGPEGMSEEKSRLLQLSERQSALESSLNALIQDRDENLAQYEAAYDRRNVLRQQYSYYKNAGNEEKGKQVFEEMMALDREIRNQENDSVKEFYANQQIGLNGWASANTPDYKETASAKIFFIKKSLKKLESERTKFGGSMWRNPFDVFHSVPEEFR